MRNCFEDTTPDAINAARPKGAGNTDEPLDITRTLEVQAMPVEAHISPIGDSANSFQDSQDDNWQSLGDAAARLVAKAEFLPISESLIDYDDEVAE